MRIVRLFPFACAAFMMSACASENDDKGGDTNAEGKAQYMAVNIVSVGTNGSRAAAEYENGLKKESQIKDVRFYFYNQDGSPYILDGPKTNWTTPLEKINDGQQNTSGGNITQETNSVLVFKPETGNSAPYSVIAVVNAGSLDNTLKNSLGDETQELNSLLTKIEDKLFYKVNIPAGSTTLTTNYDKAASAENFVMTSSVYLKDGEPQCQTLVSGHVYDKEDKAKNDPIDIYVERVVAKVTAEVNTTGSKWQMGNANNWETTKYGKVVGKTTDGKEVYAVLDGWNVADENGTAMLEKNIDKTWTDTGLGFTSSDPWNSADYHRCFWENSTEAGTTENPLINYSYTTIANNAFGPDKYVYTLPNTLNSPTPATEKYDNKLTKFIVAAHLRYNSDGKGNWKNVEICNYKGIQYIGQDAVLDVIGSESGFYIQESAGKYKSIGHEQLEFKKASNAKDYKAMAEVKASVNASDVYHKDNTTGKYEPLTSLDEVNNKIKAETADVRADGSTYYFIPISHLGSDTSIAQYGVVRNHVYKITINDMQGFGTPVVDKEAVIIPTKPENEATYLAAKIKVLSWRVVKQNADLDYSK